jgi:hypothetical protein
MRPQLNQNYDEPTTREFSKLSSYTSYLPCVLFPNNDGQFRQKHVMKEIAIVMM